VVIAEYGRRREIFFGISPTGIRIITPESLDVESMISLLYVSELNFYDCMGNPTLYLKYLQDLSTTTLKKQKFHVLPVTGQEMLRWYEYCNNSGDICEIIPLPILKPEDVSACMVEKENTEKSFKPPKLENKGSIKPLIPCNNEKKVSLKVGERVTKNNGNKENQSYHNNSNTKPNQKNNITKPRAKTTPRHKSMTITNNCTKSDPNNNTNPKLTFSIRHSSVDVKRQHGELRV